MKDRELVRTPATGALPSGPVRGLAAGDGHFTKAEPSAHPGSGTTAAACTAHSAAQRDMSPPEQRVTRVVAGPFPTRTVAAGSLHESTRAPGVNGTALTPC